VFPTVIHGIGIIATIQIPAEALILEEAPLFRLCSNEFIVPPGAALHPRWLTLPALSTPSGYGPHYDKFKANALRCGTYLRPNLRTEDAISGFFPFASLMNSSCAPNVHAHWNASKQHMEFRTLRTIHQGEELCICYDINTLLYSKEDRQLRLHDKYGFVCRCPVCSQPISTHNSDLLRSSHRDIIEKGGGSIRVSDRCSDRVRPNV
jgi:SET domain